MATGICGGPMQHTTSGAVGRPGPARRRGRNVGPRALQACLHCKEKKLKCDDQMPACGNCKRLGISCLVQDPQTSRGPRPRNYLELLEGRVASLEHSANNTATTDSSSLCSATGPSYVLGSTPSTTNYYTSPEQQRQSDNDLPSRVRMLDFRTMQMEPQYLGSSSAFAFSRIISLSLNRNLPSESGGGVGDRQGLITSPPTCPLPDYDTAVTLSNAYFKNVHPQYPFLHEPSFKAWEAKVYDASADFTSAEAYGAPLFFLNMVYAVAALLKSSTHTLAEQLYMSAQLYTDVLAHDNLESIQAILLYAMYSLRSLVGPSLWKISGLALRQCIELGYHRSAQRHGPPANILQHELRKRVFWVAQGLDCTVALRLGRPLGIPVQEIDAEFPADVDDSCISELGFTTEEPQDPGRLHISTMTHANHVFKLRLLWARIHTSILSETARFSVHDTTYQARIQQLRTDLDLWQREAVPSKPRAADSLTIFTCAEWYELNYSYTIILLYRNCLEVYKPELSQTFNECTRAARSICRGYRRLYIGTHIRYTWGTLHCLFLAGLVYLHCLWTVPSPWDTVALDDVSKTCTDCTMVLVAIAEGWRGAAPYRDTFEVLAGRTLAMMVNRERSLQAQDVPPDSVDIEEQVDWNHWLRDVLETGTLDSLDGFFGGDSAGTAL